MKLNLRSQALLAVCCLLGSAAFGQLPDNYQTLASQQKQSILWQQVVDSHQQTPLPPITEGGFWATLKKLKGLFDLKPSFDNVSDEMPSQRQKIVHANGSVAKVRLTTLGGHPFTGLFQSGAIGLARLSLATTPSDDQFVPAMAVKFLLPAKPSVNLHVMNSLEGQGSNWNFFELDFSNKIAHPSGYTLRAIEKIFAWTKSPANELTVNELAKFNDDGSKVNMPIAPSQIWFQPTDNVKYILDPADHSDFRLSLKRIPIGPIYNLYGELLGVKYLIGSLSLESPLLASVYGDNVLFFQHQR